MKEWREGGEEGRKVVNHARGFEKRLPKKSIELEGRQCLLYTQV